MRLSKFHILAAIVGLVSIVSAKIEPVMAAPVDAMLLFDTSSRNARSLGSFNQGAKATMSPAADNKTDLVIIERGAWAFYKLPGFKGKAILLGTGTHRLNSYGFKNQISSFRRVR